MDNLKIKVCGMKNPDNITDLAKLSIDYMGLIFYAKSPRYIADLNPQVLDVLPKNMERVGVFVNEEIENILEQIDKYKLTFVQLHGNESVDYCKQLKEKKPNLSIIKAFNVSAVSDLKKTKEYEEVCNYFLFDTKTSQHGGSGKKFDWSLLDSYQGEVPFFLSGGISIDEVTEIKKLSHPKLFALDLNSKFEIEPGVKNIKLVEQFIKKLKTMNRINQLFERKQKDIFSIYFTAGYPKLEDTGEIIKELEKNGVDIIEVGIPFSDPMADGPTIQESGTQALKNGMTLNLLFNQLKDVRKEANLPLIMMGYLNPIMRYGFESFCKKCQEVGVDGTIIPDLPFDDYIKEYKPIADKYDVKVIMLITPETSEERIRLIDKHTDGFIYMVSSASTTGAQQSFNEEKQDYFKRINAMNLKNPRLIGFGISNKVTLEAANANANGAIIGSKFITLLKESSDIKAAVQELNKCIKE